MKTKKKSQSSLVFGLPKYVYGVIAGAIAGMVAFVTYGTGAVILVAALAVAAVYAYYITHQPVSKRKLRTSGHNTTVSVIGFVVIGLFSMAGAHYFSHSFADSTSNSCNAVAKGTANTIGNADSRWQLSADGTTAIANVVVTGDTSCEQKVTLASWQAPNGTTGQPYEQQKFHGFATYTLTTGTYEVRLQLPDCFYQVDLVRGTEPKGTNGTPVYPSSTMMASLHGGTKACEETTTVVDGTTPPVVNIVDTSPAPPPALPSVGPGAVFIVAAFAITGGYLVHVFFRHRVTKK